MKENTHTTEEVIILLKAFHLDSVEGQYSKELLDWCNNWINYYIKNTIDFDTYMKNSNHPKQSQKKTTYGNSKTIYTETK